MDYGGLLLYGDEVCKCMKGAGRGSAQRRWAGGCVVYNGPSFYYDDDDGKGKDAARRGEAELRQGSKRCGDRCSLL